MQTPRYPLFHQSFHASTLLIACLLVLRPAEAEVLLSCPGASLGDWNDRGFFLTNYPGITLESATLEVSAYTAGTYTLTLAVLSNSYDGPVLGSATNSLILDNVPEDGVAAPFVYPSVPMPNGGTICFILSVLSGPDAGVLYNVGGGCPEVTETMDTTPPLSEFNRLGVKLTLTGQVAVAAPPQLIITPSSENVVLTWPTNAAGFNLQSTMNLGPEAIWTTNCLDPAVVNGQYTVTNPISGSQQFYRLSR